jgi:pyroglutamyl-peptidase
VRILLTGFAPWGEHRENPSGVLAEALGGHVLPVAFDGAARQLRRLIRRERPEALLMMGLAPARKKISLEALALNLEHHDEKGKDYRWLRTIRKGAPLALRSTLPLGPLCRRLERAGVPVAISHHAGTYVCNRVFYEGLSLFRGPCGFVHVPPFRRMSRSRQIGAIRTILGAIGGSSSPAATR